MTHAMHTLSTGEISTLGNYRKLAAALFGADSTATKLMDKQIADAPNHENEEVMADESQIVHLLLTIEIHSRARKKRDENKS